MKWLVNHYWRDPEGHYINETKRFFIDARNGKWELDRIRSRYGYRINVGTYNTLEEAKADAEEKFANLLTLSAPTQPPPAVMTDYDWSKLGFTPINKVSTIEFRKNGVGSWRQGWHASQVRPDDTFWSQLLKAAGFSEVEPYDLVTAQVIRDALIDNECEVSKLTEWLAEYSNYCLVERQAKVDRLQMLYFRDAKHEIYKENQEAAKCRSWVELMKLV